MALCKSQKLLEPHFLYYKMGVIIMTDIFQDQIEAQVILYVFNEHRLVLDTMVGPRYTTVSVIQPQGVDTV